MRDIRVDIHTTQIAIEEEMRALLARPDIVASARNVFLDPLALNTVFETGFAAIVVLLAWHVCKGGRELVGIWALGRGRATPFGPPILVTPAYEYAFASTPVIPPAYADEVASAFLETLAEAPRMPKVLRLKYLDAESAAGQAVVRALKERGAQQRTLAERPRPYATPDAGRKLSGSTRKKLRQDWNRLSDLGPAAVVNERQPAAVAAALETFLDLEAASWKGRDGTALLTRPRDADFARRLIAGLAGAGQASVALLNSCGRPIAAQVLLYSGPQAYTWKIAHDAEFARFSPGALLVDRVTQDLFAGGIQSIESCSPEGGFMNQMWAGHRTTLDLLVDVSGRRSTDFLLASLHETGHAELKSLYRRFRGAKPVASRPSARPPAAPAQPSAEADSPVPENRDRPRDAA